jgi:nitronate monooxygenase
VWNETRVAQTLGIKFPIIQGPLGGGLSSPMLTAIVSSAGGLGSYGAAELDPGAIRDVVAKVRMATAQPFAINLAIPSPTPTAPAVNDFHQAAARFDAYYLELGLQWAAYPLEFGQDYAAQVQAVLDAKPPVFSFSFGVPEASILQACRARGIVTIGTATTPDEAVALDRAGVDCIVASGAEAGGQKPSFLKSAEASLTGVLALVPQVVDRVQAPVIAAGGVADGRGVRAALALGAGGVQIGTAFVACEESFASPAYRELLFGAARGETVLTKAFTGRLARSLPNRLSREMQAHAEALPDPTVQKWLATRLKTAAIAQDRSDLIPLWAGQAAPLIRFRTARALFDALVAEASIEHDRPEPRTASSLAPHAPVATGLLAPGTFSAGQGG